MKIKTVFLSFCVIFTIVVLGAIVLFADELGLVDLVDDLFSGGGEKVVLVQNGQKVVINKQAGQTIVQDSTGVHISGGAAPSNNIIPTNAPAPIVKAPLSGVKVKSSGVKAIKFQNYDNGLFSMKIPQGWTVGVGKSDYIHYTFMAYDPRNPDYKIFFNMKTEGYLQTQQMRNFYIRTYPKSQMAQLPAIDPQTTDTFYKNYTQAFLLSQSLLPFKVPVIKNFKTVQTLGKNITGGTIERGVYQNEQGRNVEGVFTTTIKGIMINPSPRIVVLSAYNAVFFTAPEGELVDWMPILNSCLASVRFSQNFINEYYRQQGDVVKNANALQAICNQTSDIITSGWNARQKTYDILSQKRSDATMGYERVRDTETGEIYKATNGFMDHDWHGRYESITDDMYLLPTAGYIEKD